MIKEITLIYCDEDRRGIGKEKDPIRSILSLWSKDGKCFLKFDPYTKEFDGPFFEALEKLLSE